MYRYWGRSSYTVLNVFEASNIAIAMASQSSSQDPPASQDKSAAWTQEQESRRKPGQKYPQPTPGAADRVFYETLLEQKPESMMAKQWCLEHGCVDKEVAERLVKELAGYKPGRLGSRPAASAAASSPASTHTARPTKVRNDMEIDADLAPGGGTETMTGGTF